LSISLRGYPPETLSDQCPGSLAFRSPANEADPYLLQTITFGTREALKQSTPHCFFPLRRASRYFVLATRFPLSHFWGAMSGPASLLGLYKSPDTSPWIPSFSSSIRHQSIFSSLFHSFTNFIFVLLFCFTQPTLFTISK
jgi:hypothetical protein